MGANGDGTKNDPWTLTTPSGRGELDIYLDDAADPPVIHCQVGKTWLTYHLRALDDLYAMLKESGDWVLLGSSDEGKEPKEGSVEAWARSADNPVGGWYGLRKGFRGRFANYVPPVLAQQGKVEFEKQGRSMYVRAI